jgi:hypothetical protein
MRVFSQLAKMVASTDPQRLCWTRAVEWIKLPLFCSLLYGPLLLLKISLWKVFIIIVVLELIWYFIKFKFINYKIAIFFTYFVFLRWITTPYCVYVFFKNDEYFLLITSIIWSFIAGMIPTFGQNGIGFIQVIMLSQRHKIPIDLMFEELESSNELQMGAISAIYNNDNRYGLL